MTEAIVVVVILALIGGGYYYWRKRKVQLKAKAAELKVDLGKVVSKFKD